MGTYYPLQRTARRITYKFQTHDVRTYLFQDVVARTRRAVTRAGGELLGGVYAPPKHIRRWCVNRSPHVNKTSREHFWLITHRRIFKWDAPTSVDMDAPLEISQHLPAEVAIRVIEDRPGLMCLKRVWDTMQAVKGQGREDANVGSVKGEAASEDAEEASEKAETVDRTEDVEGSCPDESTEKSKLS